MHPRSITGAAGACTDLNLASCDLQGGGYLDNDERRRPSANYSTFALRRVRSAHTPPPPERPLKSSEFALTLTDEFTISQSERLAEALGERLKIGQLRGYLRLSDPSVLDPLIVLLGRWEAWAVLSAAAVATYGKGFLKRLAQRNADALADRWRGVSKRKQAEPIRGVAESLATARTADGRSPVILVGVPTPGDSSWGAVMRIGPGGHEDVARDLALFALHVKQIDDEVFAAAEAGKAPVGPMQIEERSDGALWISWQWVDREGDLRTEDVRIRIRQRGQNADQSE